MRLAPRLVLAFGFVATLSVAGLGYVVREDRRESESRRFDAEVASACRRVVAEIERQGESDRKLVAGACQSGELVDRALIWLEGGTLDEQRRLALSRLVPEERQAFDLDELVLANAAGEILGQDPLARASVPKADVVALVAGDVAHFRLRVAPEAALVARCRKQGAGGHAVALVGARRLASVVDRLGRTLDVRAALGPPAVASPNVAEASCELTDVAGTSLRVVIDKPRTELVENLARIDHTVLYAALTSAGVALLLAVLLARNLGRPIAELAAEARKVASGQARPLRVRGAGEISELAQAFDAMLSDLEATRRRLAASSRAAAWREVARRVAHEVKNPLAPIRAAVETLRRLRARDDPEFDRYFDEATRIVLDEVHRIANIVTEFTRFARLPPPRPVEVDVADLARQVVRLHEATEGGARIALRVDGGLSPVLADRDQIVQVLTNLVQNALDAVQPKGREGTVTVAVGAEGAEHVLVTVVDNGPGIAPQIAARLFEPYATTKDHGTGLGLAIAQRIAMEHGGELSYIATPASPGATFRLVLPVEGPPRDEAAPPAA
jgi:two-component system, NtrC family, nitrogen regulation sensor histidine kinase NtrY